MQIKINSDFVKFKYLWIFSKISNVIGKAYFGKCCNTRLKPLSVSFNSKEENLLISIPCNKNKIRMPFKLFLILQTDLNYLLKN